MIMHTYVYLQLTQVQMKGTLSLVTIINKTFWKIYQLIAILSVYMSNIYYYVQRNTNKLYIYSYYYNFWEIFEINNFDVFTDFLAS